MSSVANTLLDLDLNEDQIAIAEAVTRFCETRCDDHFVKQFSQAFDKQFFTAQWKELAEMGVFAPATPEGALDNQNTGALEICAISEALGRFVFPGPIAATFLAVQVLEKTERIAVTEGKSIVSLGNTSPSNKQILMPFAEQAHIFLLTDGKDIYRAEALGKITAVQTLGGEPWGRIDLKVGAKLANSKQALIINDISTAAYLVAAAKRLVKDASDYANVRKQFGKTLGEFQGVAHPLADCQISLTAAESLTRAAACCFDQQDIAKANEYSSAARISASRAALKSAYVCHQVFAGIGITLEGPAFHITRRIRQMVSQAPGDTVAKEILLKQIGLGKN